MHPTLSVGQRLGQEQSLPLHRLLLEIRGTILTLYLLDTMLTNYVVHYVIQTIGQTLFREIPVNIT